MEKRPFVKKLLIIGIVLLSIGTSVIPSIPGTINHHPKNTLPLHKTNSADVTITDWTDDVCSYQMSPDKWTIILNSTEIEVDNIDLTQTTYQRQGAQVTLSVQVTGAIENRGQIINGSVIDLTNGAVAYLFHLATSEKDYFINYVNQTGSLVTNDTHINLTASDFTVTNNTLSITFPLANPNETYENLSATSVFLKMNGSAPSPTFVYLSDDIPNIWMTVFLFGQYKNYPIKGEYMMIEAVHLWKISFLPFKIVRYDPGDIIRVSTPFKARIITDQFLLGMFKILWF